LRQTQLIEASEEKVLWHRTRSPTSPTMARLFRKKYDQTLKGQNVTNTLTFVLK